MAPSAVYEKADTLVLGPNRTEEKTYPPAKVFPMREVRFEKAVPIQKEGREKALMRPAGSSAIVIDAGKRTAVHRLC